MVRMGQPALYPAFLDGVGGSGEATKINAFYSHISVTQFKPGCRKSRRVVVAPGPKEGGRGGRRAKGDERKKKRKNKIK